MIRTRHTMGRTAAAALPSADVDDDRRPAAQ